MAVRRLGGLALGVLSLAVVGAGLAWACTPQAQLRVIGPNQTRAEGWVTVKGDSYPKGDAVRIRFAPGQSERPQEGQLLATVFLPDQTDHFTKNVRIPADAKPGAYVIIGVPAKGVEAFEHNRTTAGRAPIGVAAPRPAGRPTRPGDGRPTRPGDGRPDRPGDGRPDRSDLGRGGTSPDARDISGRGGRGERNRPGRSRSGNASPGARDIGARGDRVPAISIPEVSIPEGSSAPGSGAGPEVFPGSQAPAASGTEPSPSPGTAPGATAPGDRQSSSGQNAWKAPRAGEAPSLTPGRDDEEAAADPGLSPGLAIGAGLLGFGLVALFAGFAVAEVRRRRLAVHPGHRTPE